MITEVKSAQIMSRTQPLIARLNSAGQTMYAVCFFALNRGRKLDVRVTLAMEGILPTSMLGAIHQGANKTAAYNKKTRPSSLLAGR
jgi:hypothetical protein